MLKDLALTQRENMKYILLHAQTYAFSLNNDIILSVTLNSFAICVI